MKAFTGFAIGTLAVLGAVAAVFIYLKKKTEKEIAYDQFDDIMDSDEDFDDEFFDDDDEVLDPAKVMNKPEEEKAEDAAEAETAEEIILTGLYQLYSPVYFAAIFCSVFPACQCNTSTLPMLCPSFRKILCRCYL